MVRHGPCLDIIVSAGNDIKGGGGGGKKEKKKIAASTGQGGRVRAARVCLLLELRGLQRPRGLSVTAGHAEGGRLKSRELQTGGSCVGAGALISGAAP